MALMNTNAKFGPDTIFSPASSAGKLGSFRFGPKLSRVSVSAKLRENASPTLYDVYCMLGLVCDGGLCGCRLNVASGLFLQGRPFYLERLWGSDVVLDGTMTLCVDTGHPLDVVPNVRQIAPQLLDALQYMHSRGIVHSNVNPAAITHRRHQQYMLGDYTFAQSFHTAEDGHDPFVGALEDFEPDECRRAQSGMAINTIGLDVHRVGRAFPRTDIESVLYNLLVWAGVVLPWARTTATSDGARQETGLLKKQWLDASGASGKARVFPDPAIHALGFVRDTCDLDTHNTNFHTLVLFAWYVLVLDYDEVPDYDKFRAVFHLDVN